MNYVFRAKLWCYGGDAAWYFITLPREYTDEIKSLRDPHAKNFGSHKVIAKIGRVSWGTSIFPDSKSGSYLLPIKKAVREECQLEDGVEVEVIVTLADSY